MSVDVNVDTKISLLSVVDAFNIIELNSRTNARAWLANDEFVLTKF